MPGTQGSRESGPLMGRRRMLRVTAALTGNGTLGVALAGCVGSAAAPAETTAPSSKPETVKVLSFNNPLFQNAKDHLISALGETDPTLKPDVIVFPGQVGEFREKVLTMYAGGDIPDAQWIHPSITSLMAAQNLTRPLDDFAAKDKTIRLADFYQGVLDYFRWNGKAYGLP